MKQITTLLKALNLSGLGRTLELRLREASGNRLSHQEFLELILQDEINLRGQKRMETRTRQAQFKALKPLDDFDFSFNPGISRKDIYELAACHFIRQHTDVLFVGPPGVGKTHLAQAIGYEAIKQGFQVSYRSIFDLIGDFLSAEALQHPDKTLRQYLKPDLLIIDDMGLKQLPKHAGEYLFEVVMRRYENRSTIMTSNRPIEDWGKLIQDVPTASAILDRFLHHAMLIPIKGQSYRLKDRLSPRATKDSTKAATDTDARP